MARNSQATFVKRIGCTAVLFMAIACAPAMASPTGQPALTVCRPSDDVTARTVVDLQALWAPSDTLLRAMRDSLSLSATRESDISYVTDERTCTNAVKALNTYLGTPNASRQVYVFKFGTDFLVEDPSVGQTSEYRSLPIFDKKWVYKRTYLSY